MAESIEVDRVPLDFEPKISDDVVELNELSFKVSAEQKLLTKKKAAKEPPGEETEKPEVDRSDKLQLSHQYTKCLRTAQLYEDLVVIQDIHKRRTDFF